MSFALEPIGHIVTDIRSGFASGGNDPNGVVQFRMNNVGRGGEIIWDKLRRVPRTKVRKDLLVLEGDILFNATNSPELVGKTAFFEGFSEPVTFSNHFIRIRVSREVAHAPYVARCLQREFERGQFQAMCRSWVNQASITKDQLCSLSIPLPPLDEQRRIATILNKGDALRRKRKQAMELIDTVTQSTFFRLFGHTADEVAQWGCPVALADLADIGSGITKGRKLTGQRTREVPYMAVVNVQDRRLDLSSVKTIEASEEEISRYRLADGDLLLTEGGDPDKLGRGTLWAGELPEAIHQNHIFRVRITSDRILPLFLNWLVSSQYGKRYFLSVAKQTTGIASINKTQLSQFPTIVPPVEAQQRFVNLANAVARRTKSLDLSGRDINSLFSSLQHRAFAGDL